MSRKITGIVVAVSIVAVTLVAFIIWTKTRSQQLSKKSISVDKVSKLIEVADSLRNSVPDSAISYYNRIIAQISNSEIKQADSLMLALAHTGLASTYLTTGDYKSAALHDSLAEGIALQSNDRVVKSKVYLSKGTIYFRKNEYEKAIVCYEEAMTLAKKSKDSILIAKVLSNEAMLFYNQGDVKKTIEAFRQALNIGKQIKNVSLVANNYLNLATVFCNQRMNDSVLEYTSLALNLFKNNNDKIGESSCYKNLGSFYYGISDYNNAILNFQLALNLAIETGDQSSMAKGYHNLSELYARIGDNNLATKLLDKSIKIKEKLGDKHSLAKGYIAVGNLHYTRDEYTEALMYYKKSLQIFQDKKLIGEIGIAYSNIGNAFSGLQKNDSAVFYYKMAMDIYRQVGNVLGLTNLYINIGDVYRVKSDYYKSEKYFLQAINSKRELKDEEGITMVYKYLANLYFDQSKYTTGENELAKLNFAEEAGLKSYQMAKHLGLKPVMQEVSLTLMKTYEKMGKYSEALFYSKEYNALSDSILDQGKIEALAFAEARWNVEKKQNEIENLENKQKYSQQIITQKEIETQQQKFIILILVVLSLLIGISVLIFALYVKKRRDALYQKQLSNITILRMQNIRNALSPHFVFNVLNNIWAIIDDRENARAQFDHLINLIRRSLINTEKLAIPMNDEINFVKSFIELQKMRMDNNLKVVWKIEEGIDLTQSIPGMILQIPVENAIKHGLEPKKDDKVLQIDIKEESGFLKFNISDNGLGVQQSPSPTKGTGTGLKVLTNTIHILNQINDDKMTYQIVNRDVEDGPGTKVIIKIPLLYNYNLN